MIFHILQIFESENSLFFHLFNYYSLIIEYIFLLLFITAPKGYLLRLDFRDCFDLEPSDDCRFDYLEVRDGAHGYCRLLGQFCGREFPPMITSTDRFLWLRFHSDDNIEYAGFKAVYEFIPRPTSCKY